MGKIGVDRLMDGKSNTFLFCNSVIMYRNDGMNFYYCVEVRWGISMG